MPIAKGVVETYQKSRAIWKNSEPSVSGESVGQYETAKNFLECAEEALSKGGDAEKMLVMPNGLAWIQCL